jgi:hypothetical protein
MIKTVIILSLTFFSIASFSQTKDSLKIQEKHPSATVTYQTQPKVNLFIEKINAFTEGDDNLTERVIYKINKDNNEVIRRVVSDLYYLKLTEEQRKEAIKESDLIEIIEQLKK